MNESVRSLSARAEFCIVVVVAFGYMMLGNVLSVFYPAREPAITNASLQSLVVFEVVIFLVLGPLLYARGWRLSRFGAPATVQDAGVAFGLALVAYALSSAVALLAVAVDRDAASSWLSVDFMGDDIKLVNLLLVSAINPFFEEMILCGYVVTVLKERRDLWTAINVSLAIRLTCHLYQGAAGVIGIVPLGFIFTYWYARTGRLWPVVLAHALFDVAGLWPYLAE